MGVRNHPESAVFGQYGPKRPTYTDRNPAPFAEFNSITDLPNYGDELTFVDAKRASNRDSGGFCSVTHAAPSDELVVRALIDNAAAPNVGRVGTARNAMLVCWPTGIYTGLVSIWCQVTSSTTKTPAVWDATQVAASVPITIEPVGQGVTYSDAHPRGERVPKDLWDNRIIPSACQLMSDKRQGLSRRTDPR